MFGFFVIEAIYNMDLRASLGFFYEHLEKCRAIFVIAASVGKFDGEFCWLFGVSCSKLGCRCFLTCKMLVKNWGVCGKADRVISS
jgi:hypothetical protein